MSEESLQTPKIEAKSPYELRLDQCRGVSESAVREALRTGEMGFLHSFTTGSTVDGPGVRVVGWTAGCQWRCLYCHNPDTWNMMNGLPVTLDRAVEEIRKYRQGLNTMHGGFTLSGGEPLMQDRFAVRLLRACKEMDIHTAIETNGYLGSRLSDEDMNTIDLVLLGLKTWDRNKHLRLTGKDNANTLELARRLAARKTSVWVRFVLVPGLTDDWEDVAQIAHFAAGLGNVERVEVLPFHQLGRFKWQRLGLDYTLTDVKPPSPELIEWACDIFRAEGLQAF